MVISNNFLGTRNSVRCPHCGKLLTWSKWPLRIIYIVVCLLIVLICIHCVLVFLMGVISMIVFFGGILLGITLMILPITLKPKLEISDLEEQNESQEKVR